METKAMSVRCFANELVIMQTIRHDSVLPRTFFYHKIFDGHSRDIQWNIRAFTFLFPCYELMQLYLLQKQDRRRILGEHSTESVKWSTSRNNGMRLFTITRHLTSEHCLTSYICIVIKITRHKRKFKSCGNSGVYVCGREQRGVISVSSELTL